MYMEIKKNNAQDGILVFSNLIDEFKVWASSFENVVLEGAELKKSLQCKETGYCSYLQAMQKTRFLIVVNMSVLSALKE